MSLLINIPLCIFAYFTVSKKFALRSLVFCVTYSLVYLFLQKIDILNAFQYNSDGHDTIFPVLLSGVISGFVYGSCFRTNSSTGGTDIVAMMVNKYWPVSPGRVYLVTDIFIISCMLMVPGKGLVDMIYAYIIMLGFSFGVDFVLLGNKSTVQILVFSSNYQTIADHIINNVRRGVTALESVGWYSQQSSKVLLIIARKHQMNEVINEIRGIDKKAFISVSTAMSVFGEGFEEVKTGLKNKKKNQIEDQNNE